MTTLPPHARSKTQPPRHEYGFEDYLPGHLGGPLAPLNENNWHLGYAEARSVGAMSHFHLNGIAFRIDRGFENSFQRAARIATKATGRVRNLHARDQ